MADKKKSDFVAVSTIPSGATFDFVSGGTNYKITVEDLLAALGAPGSLAQSGDVLGTPILNAQGTVNYIRNLENGSGVKADISPENGATLSHNFLQDSGGVAVLRDITKTQPTFISLAEGDGIDLSLSGNQLTISTSGVAAATQVVAVNSLSDFPNPDTGVITLESNTAYVLSNPVTTSNRFQMSEGSAIVSYSRTIATLTYTGAGNMISGSDLNRAFVGNCKLDCPNGTMFNFTATTPGTGQINLDNIEIVSANRVGNINNILAFTMENCAGLSVNQGLTFSGTGSILTSVSRTAFVTTNASFIGIDLGSHTSDSLELEELLISGPSGSIAISGLASSGNITSGNLGTITNCNFPGDITPEGGGLDAANNVRWSTLGNDGIADTRPDGLISIVGNSTETVISAANTPVKMAGTWTVESDSHFTADTTGRITYNGERNFAAPIDFSTTMLMASGSAKNITVYVAVNGSIVSQTGKQANVGSTTPASITAIWQHNFATNDYVEAWVENNDDTTNIIGQQAIGRVN